MVVTATTLAQALWPTRSLYDGGRDGQGRTAT